MRQVKWARHLSKKVAALFLLMALGLFFAAFSPVCHGEELPKLAALTFDDGPGPYTQRLLDGLKERNVKVTFFLLGCNVENYSDTVARAYREGHQIANHSYDHPDLTGLPLNDAKQQFQKTNDLLKEACGEGASYLLRSPYGSSTPDIRTAAAAPFVRWSVDTLDWEDRDKEKLKQHLLNDTYDGAIVLMHDIYDSTVDGVLESIDLLKEQGYEFVTVRELFRRRGQPMENGEEYFDCPPTGTDLGKVEAPTISQQAVEGGTRVTLQAQAGAEIYYSMEGPDLNQASTLYTGPFVIPEPCTLWAVAAFQMNGSRSGVSERELRQSGLPAFNPQAQQKPAAKPSAWGRVGTVALFFLCIAAIAMAAMGLAKLTRQRKIDSRRLKRRRSPHWMLESQGETRQRLPKIHSSKFPRHRGRR